MTQEELKALLDYDPATGVFTWRARRARGAVAGGVAGHVTKWGYRRTTICGRPHLMHRLAWLYVYGAWPSGQIDHINGNRTDNRIANLRSATPRMNQHNRRAKGCCRHRRGWVAQITCNYVHHYLGKFHTESEARAAYLAAKAVLHPTAPVMAA